MTNIDILGDKHQVIEGDNIKELVELSLTKIRSISKKFYAESLKNDLNKEGNSIIDVHAGSGIFYNVILGMERNIPKEYIRSLIK